MSNINTIVVNNETYDIEDVFARNGISELQETTTELENNKVDKVTGKQLSTEDYTTEDKTKLTGVADNAQENVIESIVINGNTVNIQNKKANITMSDIGLDKQDIVDALGFTPQNVYSEEY